MQQRVTVSVPGPLLRDAERVGRRRGLRTRSAVVADALRLLVRDSRLRDVDAELDAYYRSQTRDERAEEKAMLSSFKRSRRRLNLDRDG